MSTFPITVEIGLGQAPTTASPTWTDVSAYVLTDAISIVRGVTSGERLEPQPGEATFTLLNTDRRFDPANASGPYYGDLTPRCPVRISITATGSKVLFRGFIDGGWNQSWNGDVRLVEVHALDGLGWCAQVTATDTAWEWTVNDILGADLVAWYRPRGGTDPSVEQVSGKTLQPATAPEGTYEPCIAGADYQLAQGVHYYADDADPLGTEIADYTVISWYRWGDGDPLGAAVYGPFEQFAYTAGMVIRYRAFRPWGVYETHGVGLQRRGQVWLSLHYEDGSHREQWWGQHWVDTGAWNGLWAEQSYFDTWSSGWWTTSRGIELNSRDTSHCRISTGDPWDALDDVDGPTAANYAGAVNKDYQVYDHLSGTVVIDTDTDYRVILGEPRAAETTWAVDDVVLAGRNVTRGEATTLYEAGQFGWSDDTIGGRIDRLTTMSTWPLVGTIETETGRVSGVYAGGGRTVLDHMRDMAAADLGHLHTLRTGEIAYDCRDSWWPEQTATILAIDDPSWWSPASGWLPVSREMSPVLHDDRRLTNVATVTRDGGTPQTARNDASVTAYGEKSTSSTVGVATDAEARRLAEWMVYVGAEPRARIEQLVFKPRRLAGMDAVLAAAELGDYVATAIDDSNIGAYVVGITHTFSGSEWTATLHVDSSFALNQGDWGAWGTSNADSTGSNGKWGADAAAAIWAP